MKRGDIVTFKEFSNKHQFKADISSLKKEETPAPKKRGRPPKDTKSKFQKYLEKHTINSEEYFTELSSKIASQKSPQKKSFKEVISSPRFSKEDMISFVRKSKEESSEVSK